MAIDNANLARQSGKMGECTQCGKEIFIEKRKSFNKHGNFCSRACMGKWNSENLIGIDHPLYKKIKKKCLVCGKKFYTDQSTVRRGEGKYCSHDCSNLAQKTGKKSECAICGKVFYTCKSQLDNGRGKFCSKECRDIGRKRGEQVKCPTCGKYFYVTLSELRAGGGKYCSLKCRGLAKRRGRMRKCQMCGKEFYATQAALKKGNGKYCSRQCALKAMPSSQTKPELIFADICTTNEIEIEYTGDKRLWVKNINPDYVYYNGRKRYAIFINGNYWHDPFLRPQMRETQRPEYQMETCKQHRWIPLLIWESDLKREDAEVFVLHLLKKVGLI